MKNLIEKFSKINLLSSSNKKLEKGGDVTIHGLSLLPHTLGGGKNLCAHATPGCKATCLVFSGNARFKTVNMSRKDRTDFYNQDRHTFLAFLNAELVKINAVAKYKTMPTAVRLNVFSDIAWEKQVKMDSFEEIQFYDYTKNYKRMLKFLGGQLPKNYDLTLSATEENWNDCKNVMDLGGNSALVFKLRKNQPMPTEYDGYKVINGDLTDYRPNDEKGVIVGLRFKNAVANKNKNQKEIYHIDLR